MKLHAALLPYHNAGDNMWKLAGVHGQIPEFDDYDELAQLVSQEQNNCAEKVRHHLILHVAYNTY